MYGGRNRRAVSLVRLMMILALEHLRDHAFAQSAESKFGGDHQSQCRAPPDAVMPRLERFNCSLEVPAQFRLCEAAFASRSGRSPCMATAQASGPPPKVLPCIPGLKHSPPHRSQIAPERKPACDWFCDGDDVRLDVVVLKANHLPVRPSPLWISSTSSNAPLPASVRERSRKLRRQAECLLHPVLLRAHSANTRH